MRQYKFRFWYRKEKRWLYNVRIDNNGDIYPIDSNGEEDATIDCLQVEKSQFTGLKDKNGKEIYEGDVVTYQQSERFGESVSDYRTIVKYEEYSFTPMKYHSECEDGFYSCLIGDIEVIGNIYENPEQLV